MKRILLFILLLTISSLAICQVENIVYGKTVVIKTRDTSSAELKIVNSTRNVAGYLKNIGGGLTRFVLPDYNELVNKPTTFTPSSHTHGNADITDLAWSKITGAPSFISVESDPVWTSVSGNYWLGARVGDSIAVIRSLAQTKITLSDADGRYLKLTGGNLTGSLTGTTSTFSIKVTTDSVITNRILFGNSTVTDDWIETRKVGIGRKGVSFSNDVNTAFQIYSGGNATLGAWTESDRTLVFKTVGGGSLENFVWHSAGIGNLMVLSVPQNRAYIYLPTTFSSNVTVSGSSFWGGSSGGLNRIFHDASLSFRIRSDFDTLRLQAGADNGNFRDMVFYIGDTRVAWIPRSTRVLTADYTLTLTDNNKSFATTEYVKGNLAIYLPLTGGTLSGTLAVTSNLDIRGSSNPNITLTTNSTTTTTMFQIIGASFINSPPYNANRIVAYNSSHLAFETGLSERMRINSDGNVGIGTTSPTGKFTVSGIDNSDILTILANGNSRLHVGTNSSAQVYIRSQNSVSLNLGVDGSNHLTIISGGASTFSSTVTATGFIVSSDRRYKNIIKKDGDTYLYTSLSDPTNKLRWGYVSQDVEKWMPDAVTKNEFGYGSVNYTDVLVYKVRQLEKEIERIKKSKK